MKKLIVLLFAAMSLVACTEKNENQSVISEKSAVSKDSVDYILTTSRGGYLRFRVAMPKVELSSLQDWELASLGKDYALKEGQLPEMVKGDTVKVYAVGHSRGAPVIWVVN